MAKKTLAELQQYCSSRRVESARQGKLSYMVNTRCGFRPTFSTDRNSQLFDFQEFFTFSEERFQEGDYISFGESIGHIRDIMDGCYILDAHSIGDSFRVIFNDFSVPSNIEVCEPTDLQVSDFMKRCHHNGHVLDESGYVKVPILNRGDWIYWYDENIIKVVADVNEDDAVLLSLESDGRSDPERVHLWERPYRLVPNSSRKRVYDTFSDNGFVWDPSVLQFVEKHPRADLNDTYWYITDHFSIRAEADRRTPTHNKRYLAGNYFLTVDDARVFLESIQDQLHLLRSGKRLS
jgi:hypothetical protein